MVPTTGALQRGRSRLPRSRGDGPKPALMFLLERTAPPLTRGWSLQDRRYRDHEAGSPAHAGMVPTRSSGRSTSARLPRSRGDGPSIDRERDSSDEAPPLTRPSRRSRSTRSRRLPRSRGDGPVANLDSEQVRKAPPLTRGWSPLKRRSPSPSRGSPAHAGMVPILVQRRARHHGLPRSRGDGPEPVVSLKTTPLAPPLTRGWSHCDPEHPPEMCGSPAHAGMVPRRRNRHNIRSGLPRSRGDGPSSGAAGDVFVVAPPLTRGWSPSAPLSRVSSRGSPAHAGMVPCRWTFEATIFGLPRSRGDGPHSGVSPSSIIGAPPLTRGWSLRHRALPLPPEGSPAHAGMVPPHSSHHLLG